MKSRPKRKILREPLHVVLFDEAKSIARHSRAAEIFSGEWLHDGDLPVPSAELIVFLSYRFLTGAIVEFAASHSEAEVIAEALSFMCNESDVGLQKSIGNYLLQMRALELEISDSKHPFRHEWFPLMEAFLFPASEAEVAHQAGLRRVARKFLEILLHRALFTLDLNRIRCLGDSLALMLDSSSPRATNATRFAILILRERPAIEKALGFPPSKAQTKAIIEGVIDDLPDDSKAWSKASNMVPWPAKDRSSKRLSKAQLSKIICDFRNRLKLSS